MNISIRPEKKNYKYSLKDNLTIKRAPTSSYNNQIFKRLKSSHTKFDIEKAHYEAELLLDEQDNSEMLKNQSMFERKDISAFKFYCHLLEGIDWLYLILAIIGLLVCGLARPLLIYINSNVYSEVGNTSEYRSDLSAQEIMKLNVKETMESHIKKQMIYGSVSLVGIILGFSFLGLVGTKCLFNFKKKYFTLILSQEQGWFDTTNVFEFATKIQAQLEYIELGLGEGLVRVVVDSFVTVASLIFAFFGSWKLTLVLLCFFPLAITIGIFLNKLNVRGNTLVRQTWELAGGIGEEIFYNIKTVASFANFDYELKRFYEKVEISNKIENIVNLKIMLLSASFVLMNGLIVFVAIMYGRTLLGEEYNSFRGRDLKGGDIALTFNIIVCLVSAFVQVATNLQYVQLSLAATSDYFNLYERKPLIDNTNSIEKPPLSDIKGKIEFNNVNFYYPSDYNHKLILNGMNLNLEAGKKIALIGQSGCGKTTVVNLIERLYDITGGEILLDGIDIRKYDIQYLRNLIGYVEQEPVLFNKTIRENIIFGREKYLKESNADIDSLLNKACEDAYVSQFINNLPQGLDYIVGIKGSKLSGGQKQRIAIARAILIKPKILILDEATSALDNKSEQVVQKALDNISKMNITTIIIAHRLSTIKNADIIYALKDGKVYEQGTHEELLNKGGYYADIIRPQLIKNELDEHNKKEEYIRKMTSVKRTNTDEEVHFENRINEISKSPDDVKVGFCILLKDLWKFKVDFIIACIAALALGIFQPFNGYYIGKCINAINSIYNTKRYDDGRKYAIIYLILEFGESIANFITFWKFFGLGINLAKMYRNKMMKKYLSFHLSYYDIDRNSPGSILTKMSIDTIQMREFIKNIIGISIISISIIITSLIMGCYYEYRLTLITILFLPFLVFINILRRLLMQVDNKRSIESNMEGGSIISECVTNTRTIFAYNFQKEAIRLYLEAIDYITQQQVRDSFINGVTIGITFFANYCKNAAIFAATKRYVLNDSMNTEEMSIIQNIIGGCFMTIATYMRDVGHIKKAFVAIKSIYSTLETKSLISPYSNDNYNKITADNIKGKIEFKHVYFAYPSNPEHVILKDINMTILPNQKVALVGYSGCGKSSVIQLINRFYDVEEGKGEILIDDINIKDYNLYELRKKIGLVSQEPSIFKTTNLENIRYGNLDATDEQCKSAANEANALSILQKDEINESLDEKPDKKKYVLSGGQKQKLAIARTVLKNPVILLLDEATSALDKNSELEVEKSLDKLSMNKTTVSIAHRLNTIENSDKIFVFDNGRIVEQGTHSELMKLKKRYYTLYQYSNLS